VRLDFYVRSSNLKKHPIKNPAPLLQATRLGLKKISLLISESYKCFRLTFAEACPFRGLSHKKFLGNFGFEILAHDSVTFRIRM